MLVTWDDDIPNIWKVIKFHGSKPPSSKSLKSAREASPKLRWGYPCFGSEGLGKITLFFLARGAQHPEKNTMTSATV